MSEFSLALSEDQVTLQKWIHEFAVDVIRPNAEEWDEAEAFPWPVVKQAAEIGLYGWEFMAEIMMNDPTGITTVMAIEEIFWGDAGIGMALMGSGLAAAGIAASGTPEQLMEWVPQCYGTADDVLVGAFCASEPDAGSDVNGYRTSARYDEATDEWVLNGTKAWITNGGIANIHVVVGVVAPEFGSKGHASFIVPPNTPGLSMGQKYKKHGIRASHTAEVVLDDVRVPGHCLLGGKEKLDERLARVSEGHPASSRRPGTRHCPRRHRVRNRVREGTPRLWQADHYESGNCVHTRRHGHRGGGGPGPHLEGRLARQAAGVQERRRFDGQAQGRTSRHVDD